MTDKTPPDEKKKQALIKAKQAGFAHGRQVEPHKKTATELVDDSDILPRLVKKSLKGMERAIDSDDLKLAASASAKFLGLVYRPTTQVNVSGSTGTGDVNIFHLANVDGLTDVDRSLFERAKAALAKDEADIIEAEVVEVEEVDE